MPEKKSFWDRADPDVIGPSAAVTACAILLLIVTLVGRGCYMYNACVDTCDGSGPEIIECIKTCNE
jgi:hypothetical protein